MWLDAGRQNAARKRSASRRLGSSTDRRLVRRSGGRHHFNQDRKDSRPIFRDHGAGQSVLFDGEKAR